MLDSQARIVEPPRRIGIASGALEAESAVRFQFQVCWSSLFVALESAGAPAHSMLLPEARPSTIPATQNPAGSVPAATGPAPASGSPGQWEMVIPKMVRPSNRPSTTTETIGPPLPCDLPEFVAKPKPAARWPWRWRRRTATLAIATLASAALLAGLAIPLLMRINRPVPRAPAAGETGGGSWMRETSAPVGAIQARQLVLYRPSLHATDCRLEFTWTVSGRPLAWTFRAKDKDNYYGMAIKALRTGPAAAFSVEHFTVYQGVESPHADKVLILAQDDTALHVRMDVTGATFKLYLEGNAADYWTDSRLAAGGLGFLEQTDQPAQVQSVRMSFSQSGGA